MSARHLSISGSAPSRFRKYRHRPTTPQGCAVKDNAAIQRSASDTCQQAQEAGSLSQGFRRAEHGLGTHIVRSTKQTSRCVGVVRIASPRGHSQSRSHRVPSVQGTSPILLVPSSSAETADRGKSRRKGSGTKQDSPRVASLHRNCGHDSRWPVWSTPLSALCKVTSGQGSRRDSTIPFFLSLASLDASHGNGFPCRRSHGDPMAGREHAGGRHGPRRARQASGQAAQCEPSPGHARQTTHSWRAVINTKVNCVRAQVRV